MTRISMMGLVAAALLIGATPALAQPPAPAAKPATTLRTDEYRLHSDAIGRDFIIEVTQPDGLRPGQKAPVVYALDGGFGIVGPMTRLMTGGARMGPAFVVAIGYDNPLGRQNGPRNTDLMHVRAEQNGQMYGGGGAAFETFIMQTVRPFIEARYAVDATKSVLMGHSGGGLFAATVLAEHPDAFYAYVIGSPDLRPDKTLLGRLPAAAAKGKGQRVFVGYTPSDGPNISADKFAPAISGKDSGLKVKTEVFPDETHTSAYIQLASRGLPYVLPIANGLRTAIALPAAKLNRYVGTYRLADGTPLVVSRTGAQLFGKLGANSPLEIYPESEGVFFAKTVNAEVRFTLPATGAVQALTLVNNGQPVAGTRVP